MNRARVAGWMGVGVRPARTTMRSVVQRRPMHPKPRTMSVDQKDRFIGQVEPNGVTTVGLPDLLCRRAA